MQSGFVIGFVIAALLIADRLGGATTLALRGTQLALALVLAMLVITVTATVAGPFEPGPGAFPQSERELISVTASFTRLESVVGTVHAAVAIAFVAFAAALSRRGSALAPSLLVAGILLLIIGVPDAWPGTYVPLLYGSVFGWASGAAGETGDARNVARLVVLAAGVGLLAVVIHLRWERAPGDTRAEDGGSNA